MIKYLLVFLLALNCTALFAQDFEQGFETQFVWEVKQLNEFIDRFNNDKTMLKQYYKNDEILKTLTRERLIKSLFNIETKSWNLKEVDSFIKYADNKKSPKYLDFFAGNWFAKVNCAVTWKRKPEHVVLTLKLQHLANHGYKWIVTDASAGFLKIVPNNKSTVLEPFLMPNSMDTTKSLNPMSHATDFMSISKVFDDKANIANYFVEADECNAETQQFIIEGILSNLKIRTVNTITYNFRQIKGWDIEVQQFNRSTNNSGWLISKLTKIGPETKID